MPHAPWPPVIPVRVEVQYKGVLVNLTTDPETDWMGLKVDILQQIRIPPECRILYKDGGFKPGRTLPFEIFSSSSEERQVQFALAKY